MKRRNWTLTEEFFARFTKRQNGCWIWKGRRSGYGMLSTGFKAHRFSWQYHWGPIPEGMMICHECNNPPCVNPMHLYCGNRFDNAQDLRRRYRAERFQRDHSKSARRLSVWLVEKKRKKQDFAEKIGVSVWQLSRYINGAKTPSKGMRDKIEAITDGKVRASQWATLIQMVAE